MAPRTRVERAVDIAVDNFVDYLKPWGHGSKQSRTWWVAFRPADSPAHEDRLNVSRETQHQPARRQQSRPVVPEKSTRSG